LVESLVASQVVDTDTASVVAVAYKAVVASVAAVAYKAVAASVAAVAYKAAVQDCYRSYCKKLHHLEVGFHTYYIP
jgi:hypothetical protein